MPPVDAPANPPPPPSFRVHLLGAPGLLGADGLRVNLPRKDAALLALLAIDGPQSPQRLWDLLWPGRSPHQASANLRQRAQALKQMAGTPVLQPRAPERLADALGNGAPPAAAQPHGIDLQHIAKFDDDMLCNAGSLLDGVDLGDLGDLDAWLQQARERITQRLLRRLAERAQALEREGRLDAALRLTEHLIERDPDDELAWQRLISLHYLRGNRTAALAAYWRFADRLRADFGGAPSGDMQRLAQTIEAADAPPPAAAQWQTPVGLQRPPVLVGRGPAWAVMAEAWPQQRAFVLVADAGMGKTRLLEDFLQGSEGVFAERAQPGDAGIAYALLGRLLAGLHAIHQPELSALQRQELARLRPEFGPAPTTPAHTPLLWQAADALLHGAHAAGLVAIVLDDLHNADSASLEALRWLGASRRLQSLNVGLASRPGWAADGPLAGWLADSQRPVRIDLRALGVAELSALLASLALPPPAYGALAERLHRIAGGNVLFTLATLKAALGAGIDLQASAWPRPSGIEALLDERLRTLPADAHALLHVAAAAGADFRAELAAHVLDQPVLALANAWRALEAADVLVGAAFCHDLIYEAALRALPLGLAQALHRRIAQWLADRPSAQAALPARVAAHWQAGNSPADAGRWWHAAGQAAHTSGRLDEQLLMFERAAAAHQQAGQGQAQFESAFARLPALRLRHGGNAVLEALPAVDALAGTRAQRLRCALARAEALVDLERSREALAVTSVAVREATLHPASRAEADALHAYALAQCGDDAAAQAAAAAGLNAAEALGNARQQLLVLTATQYVHYAAGRLADAVRWLERAVVQAEALGDRAAAATAEGDLAATLSAIGDVPGSWRHALACRARHAEIGLAEGSTAGVVNHLVIGNSAAGLGLFDQSLEALQTALALCGEHAAAGARAKARLALARLWLRLGRPDLTDAAVETLPADAPPAMRIHAQWLRAEAAQQVGASPRRAYEALLALVAQRPAPRLVNSHWFEWSYACADAPAVIDKLAEVRALCAAQGLTGTGNTFRWRQLVRWLDIPGDAATAAALAHAQALEPVALAGTSARCHPPRTLATLADAYRRAGDAAGADRCVAAAFGWLDAAWPHVPAAHRTTFAAADAIHRRWAQERQR